jgi:hypothetical protein
MQPLIVSGAYGRDYKTRDEAVEAWNSGHAFVLVTMLRTSYLSKETTKGVEVWIRYNGDRNKCRAQ